MTTTTPTSIAGHELDTTDLDAAPEAVKYAYENNDYVTIYLVTTYPGGEQHHRTGRVSKTTGWKPGYLLMSSSRAMGSSDLLTTRTWENTVVAGIQHGTGAGYYTPGNRPASIPGVTYRDERPSSGGTNHRVMPGRNRFTQLTDTI